MPLRMTMEPQEWLMIGDTKVTNIYRGPATFLVDGSGPVLRQAHTLEPQNADTPIKRVYLAVQRLYLGMTDQISEYQQAASDLLVDAPAAKEVIAKANLQMAKGSVYGALREYRKLLDSQPV